MDTSLHALRVRPSFLVLLLGALLCVGCPSARIEGVEVMADGSGIFVLTRDTDFAHVPERCVVEASYGNWRSRSTPPISRGVLVTRTELNRWAERFGSPAPAQDGVLRVRFLYEERPLVTRDFHGIEFDPTAGAEGRNLKVQVQLNQNQNTNTNVNNNTSLKAGHEAQPRDQAASKFCSECGKSVSADHRFCANCGGKLR